MKTTIPNDGFKPVKTNQNSHLFKPSTESDFGPSVTVPDQSMSVKEILDRFARGLPLDGARVPIWDGEEETPDLRRLDLAEIEYMIRENKAEIEALEAHRLAISPQTPSQSNTNDPSPPSNPENVG